MAIKLDLIGKKSKPIPFSYSWKDTVLYALGVGVKADELDFLYEGRGPKVLPTFAVVPSFTSMIAVAGDLGANPMMILHGEQKIILHRPIPPGGTLATVSEVKAIYDKGKGAVVVVETRTSDESGAPVFDNVFSIFVRGEGGFGGERGPEAVKAEPPATAPDFEVAQTTTPEQALLYRLSGDYNPLARRPAWPSSAASTARSCTACARTASPVAPSSTAPAAATRTGCARSAPASSAWSFPATRSSRAAGASPTSATSSPSPRRRASWCSPTRWPKWPESGPQ